MVAEGRCNCSSIKVSIPQLPAQSAVCYCSNCRRAGSAAFSLMYFFDKKDVEIKDPSGVLKSYTDSNTKSGNTITRQFCGNCGSPIASLLAPDSPKIILKGGLFDHLPEPFYEAFEEDKPTWLQIAKAEKKVVGS